MPIRVPENVGGELRLLPEDTYDATLQDLFLGKSTASGQPKLTAKWVITSEYSGKKGKDYISTVGESVLESYSLQPQALWKLNTLYKKCTGKTLNDAFDPEQEYTEEEFAEMVKSALIGFDAKIRTIIDSTTGDDRTTVEEIL